MESPSVNTSSSGESATTENTKVPFLVVLLCCIPLAFVAWQFAHSSQNQRLIGLDFRAFYTSGTMLLHGAPLYDLQQQWQWQHRIWPELQDKSQLLYSPYPPYDMLPMALIALLPLQSAFAVWMVAETLSLALFCWLLLNSLENLSGRQRVLVMTLVLTSLPVLLTLVHGQLSFALALVTLLAWRNFKSGNEVVAGAWIALLMIKPQYIVVPLLILLVKRRWKAVAGAAAGMSALLIVSVSIVGVRGLIDYMDLLSSASRWGDALGVHPQSMHSWRSFLHRLLHTDNASAVQLPWLVGSTVVLLLLLRSFRGEWQAQSSRFDLQMSLLLFSTTFCSPHVNTHDLCLLLIASGLMINAAAQNAAAQYDVRECSFRHWLVALPILGYCVVWLWLILISAGWQIVPITVPFQLAAIVLLSLAIHRTNPMNRTSVAHLAL